MIVKDVAEDGAFDQVLGPVFFKRVYDANVLEQAVQSSPSFDYVLHTASPFHFNVQDPVKDFLDPAIKGTTGILKAIKAHAPSVKRVVITSSFAAIVNGKQHPKLYSERDWNPVTWQEAMDHSNVYRASKVSHFLIMFGSISADPSTRTRLLPKRPRGTSLTRRSPISTLQLSILLLCLVRSSTISTHWMLSTPPMHGYVISSKVR